MSMIILQRVDTPPQKAEPVTELDIDKVKAQVEEYREEQSYERLRRGKERTAQSLSKSSLTERLKSFAGNVKNIGRNAVDNTLGFVVAKNQNRQTRKFFRKKPTSNEKIIYLMHGLFQNEGSQWRLGRELGKGGKHPYHLKGNHSLPPERNADKAFDQIEEFHKEAKLRNVPKRRDQFSGHSSGADMGIYMAGDDRIKEYGIAEVQARAPAPSGLEAKTLGQKLLMPIIGENENAKTKKGKKNALKMASRRPKVPVYVVSGKYDTLVRPSDATYKHAEKHYVITSHDSTHFGTSGGNEEMNKLFVNFLDKKSGTKSSSKYKHTYKAAA